MEKVLLVRKKNNFMRLQVLGNLGYISPMGTKFGLEGCWVVRICDVLSLSRSCHYYKIGYFDQGI